MAQAQVFFNIEVESCILFSSFAQWPLERTLGGWAPAGPHTKSPAPCWMWDSCSSDTLRGRRGSVGVSFCALLPCMARISLVKVQVGGGGAEGVEASVWPFSFGKGTFLLAVTLGEEHRSRIL